MFVERCEVESSPVTSNETMNKSSPISQVRTQHVVAHESTLSSHVKDTSFT